MENELTDNSPHITVDDKKIGDGHPCFIIAEAGVCHFGDINKAYELIDLAVSSGADAFKLQHFRTNDLVNESSPEWRARLQTKELSDESILKIKSRCDEADIMFLCTGHTESVIDFLDKEVNVPAFKIGSGEIENWPYIKGLAKRGKPIILSTGMYELEQIKQAIKIINENGAPPLAILHCVTNYPAAPETINLLAMKKIRSFFSGPIGYSDHTAGTAIPLAAVAMGAKIIEKHITIDKNIPNAQDWKVSCDPSDFPEFVKSVRDIEAAMGSEDKVLSSAEKSSIIWARKSLVANKFIKKSDLVDSSMIIFQRPGTGMPPSQLEQIVGKHARRDIKAGEILSLSDFI